MQTLELDRIDSPIGELVLVVDGDRLCALDYADCEARMLRLLRRRYGPVELVPAHDPQGFRAALRAYFAGEFQALDAIPITTAGTPFQERVWALLRSIPVGEARAYGAVAAELGNVSASRAVGLANALNPIALVVPCHRLIGARGALTGYAGGLWRKRWLLAHEKLWVDPVLACLQAPAVSSM